MQRTTILIVISVLVWIISACGFGERAASPEHQISFAKQNKPHNYYVHQAELWWHEIEKNSSSESNWYNYYRACRNAQGTADWKKDFVEESPYLRLGRDIVLLMEKNIPETFTYYFVKGSTGGVDPSNGKDLMKAYRMNPSFPGIHPNIVTFATSTHQPALRKEVNQEWYKLNEMNPGLLLYARNVLMSVRPEGILLTQHDNDTYPVWMLQDAEGLRRDVTVINIDFLLLESFRDSVFKEIGIPPFHLDSVNVDDYRENWTNVVHHLMMHYSHKRPLHIGLTVSPKWYEDYNDSLQLMGLTRVFVKEIFDEITINQKLIEEEFNLDRVNYDFKGFAYQQNVIDMNVHYLKPMKLVYDKYAKNGELSKMAHLRKIARKIALRTEDQAVIERVKREFN